MSGWEVEGTIRFETGLLSVYYSNAVDMGSVYENESTCSEEGYQILPSMASRVFTSMQGTISGSFATWQHTRGGVEVILKPNISISAYYHAMPWGPAGWGDHIDLKQDDSHIWGAYGRMVRPHEYGHAMHDRAFGGIPQHDCPSPHYFELTTNLRCAWVEGFAEYHAAVLDPDNPYSVAVKDNAYYFGGDGSRVEGVVAAFLIDVTDPPDGEPGDNVYFSGHHLGETMRLCTFNWYNQHITGVDMFVYCLERTIDPAVTATYFSTGSTYSYIATNAYVPPGWSLSNVRQLWKSRLYGQN